MTLDEYLIAKDITTAAFAKRYRFKLDTVSKWRQGARLPRRLNMRRIHKITRGRVSYRDWF